MQKGRENKPHIGIFGRRNVGKSSIINMLTGQQVSIVSDIAGTTTDPVKKSIELQGIGPVIIIDTAGIDDYGALGLQRIEKSLEAIKIIDLAILVISENAFDHFEKNLIVKFNELDTPFIIIYNKCDIITIQPTLINQFENIYKCPYISISTTQNPPIKQTIELIKNAMPTTAWQKPTLLGNLVKYGDIVLLICPIDIEAPEGRLILPQVQAIRDALDNDCVCIVLKEREADAFLRNTAIKPALVITDSSIFLKVNAIIPPNIPLTGFSILLARHKGPFAEYLQGTPKIAELKNNDRVLLLESCTHHVSCDDIGRVKIPRWISNFTGCNLHFDIVASLDKCTRPITDYALVIQCGGCMVTRKQIFNRLQPAINADIPVTNYGMAIAFVQGIYNRAIEPFVGNKNNCYL